MGTRFVVVCISEYLSISESRRLLGELDRFEVVASHIVVNQLVTDYLTDAELSELEEYANTKEGAEGAILEKALAASRLTTARRNIQSKYLKELRNSPEVKRLPDPEEPTIRTNRRASTEPLTVLEVPLLPSEVTGQNAILEFSHYLIGKEIVKKSSKSVGVEGDRSKKARADEAKAAEEEAALEAISGEEKRKQRKEAKEKQKKEMKKQADDMLAKVMADPELAAMINESPKLKGIVEEVKDNPMAGMKYKADPEVAPFMRKAMDKLMPGGIPGLPGGLGGKGGKGSKGGKGAGLDIDGLADMMKGMGALGDLAKGAKRAGGEL